jgi:hypothetical protein
MRADCCHLRARWHACHLRMPCYTTHLRRVAQHAWHAARTHLLRCTIVLLLLLLCALHVGALGATPRRWVGAGAVAAAIWRAVGRALDHAC